MELKPCPFCGGKATLYYNEKGLHHNISCNECSAEKYIAHKDSEDRAIKAWNTRVSKVVYPSLSDIQRKCNLSFVEANKALSEFRRLNPENTKNNDWEYELAYLTDEDIATPKGVKKWVMENLERLNEKGDTNVH